ncbi:MAG: insulinase family protein [Desulfuromonadales bacterium]|nr:insulinase family protein [Desulfuromonadales bacterium]
MRSIWKLLASLLVCGLSLTACAPGLSQRPEQLSYPPLEFHIPDVEKIELANGIRVYLREDSELPLVQVTAMIGSGTLAAPRELTGFDDLFAAALRTGGTLSTPAAAMEERIDLLAANLSCDMGPYTTQLDLSVRRDDLAEGLTILGDLLRRPDFAADKLELARRRALEALRRRNDEPDEIASRLLLAALYPDHPLGDYPTEDSLRRITREQLLAFHRERFAPDSLWLAVSGDIRKAELLPLLQQLLGNWPRAQVLTAPLPPLFPPRAGLLQMVTKDVPQSTIMLGDLGVTKDSPDQYPGRVMNFIFGGGGFNSRLMREIRSDRGLAYSAWSQFQVGRRFPGPVMAGTETKNASVVESLTLMRAIMTGLRENPVDPEELRVARESLVNSFVFSFTDPHAVVVQRMQLDFYDYPPDYLERYQERIAAVGAGDVQRVARQYLRPERQQIVVIGTPDETGVSLESLGLPVQRMKAQELP